MLVSTGIVAVA